MRVVLLTVADPEIGLGHLYRCDALAQALALEGASATLVVASQTGEKWLRARAPESPFRMDSWNDRVGTTRSSIQDVDLIVVDSYVIAADVRACLVDQAVTVAWFDDLGEEIPDRGIIINGGPGARFVPYPPSRERTYFLGLDYQVLRPPFWSRPMRRVRPRVERIGVMIGGTDPFGLGPAIAGNLVELSPGDRAVTLFGAGNHVVDPAVRQTGFLDPMSVRDAFDDLDFLVTAAGQTVSEAVSRGLPCVLVQTAENQTLNVKGWNTLGVSLLAGFPGDSDLDDRIVALCRHWLLEGARREVALIAENLELWRSAARLATALVHFTGL